MDIKQLEGEEEAQMVSYFSFHVPCSVPLSILCQSPMFLWILALLFCFKGCLCSRCILYCHIPDEYTDFSSRIFTNLAPLSTMLSSCTKKWAFTQWGNASFNWTSCIQGACPVTGVKAWSSCEGMALFYILNKFYITFILEEGKPTRCEPYWTESYQDLRNLSSLKRRRKKPII